MNHLKNAKSLYLKQHQDNPVHWHEWSPETLAKAQKENKPILLSSGYSACHWCHVMAHESFEDPETAALMNMHFINIKIDREERPDLDMIYQQALSLTGEAGGWPLTMFLNPKGDAFFGGTYFPPKPMHGRPDFKTILTGIASSWETEQDKIEYNSIAIRQALTEESIAIQGQLPDEAVFKKAAEHLITGFDPKHGGFGSAPKFPQVSLLEFMWKYGHISDDDIYRKAILITLDNICQGGLYDHVGGGFFRYATDDIWLVPHFEKMLYDNALMIQILTAAYQSTKNRLYKTRITETINWLFSEMSLPDTPCFASAIDADSCTADDKKSEGAYYLWTKPEIDSVIGANNPEFNKIYGVLDVGNTILNRINHQAIFNEKKEADLRSSLDSLKNLRDKRPKPTRDDKVLTDWNAMMAVALIDAGEAFQNPKWIKHAENIFEALIQDICHCHIEGQATSRAMLDDYAWLMLCAIKLERFNDAKVLLKQANASFLDTEKGGYFIADKTAKDTVIPIKTANDTATPSANATMIKVLNILDVEACAALIKTFSGEVPNAPFALGGYLSGCFDYHLQNKTNK